MSTFLGESELALFEKIILQYILARVLLPDKVLQSEPGYADSFNEGQGGVVNRVPVHILQCEMVLLINHIHTQAYCCE